MPNRETLFSLKIARQAGQSEDEFNQYLEMRFETFAKEEFGPAAIHASPSWVMDSSRFVCPRCGERTAKLEFVAFS